MTGNVKIKTLLATEDENENRRGETIMMNRRQLMSMGFVEGAGVTDLGSLQSSEVLQDSYEDSRAELAAMGHNLVSRLIKI